MPDDVEYIFVGNRVPCDYCLTKGVGESDITVHAGSLDDALENAGIENFNLIKYTSIMPAIARRVDRPKRDVFELNYKGKAKIVHGSVCEAIMAQSDCRRGDRATAGLVIGWIYDKEKNKRFGGLVAEYTEHEEEPKAQETLRKMMERMGKERLKNRKNLELRDLEIETASIEPKKNWGTAIVAIGFLSYVIPMYGKLDQKKLDELYAYKSLDVPKVDGQNSAPKAEAATGGNKTMR
ncbi:MAG: pyruvoyl-dependent arginine decarboxylase [Candidatus Aenigmatarchaeota archaeon]